MIGGPLMVLSAASASASLAVARKAERASLGDAAADARRIGGGGPPGRRES
jgi:hypothetical protein